MFACGDHLHWRLRAVLTLTGFRRNGREPPVVYLCTEPATYFAARSMWEAAAAVVRGVCLDSSETVWHFAQTTLTRLHSLGFVRSATAGRAFSAGLCALPERSRRSFGF